MTLELTDQQAKVFLLLSQAHAWDIKDGSVEIHFSGGLPVMASAVEKFRLEVIHR